MTILELLRPFAPILAGVFGLLVGSFVNVVVHRIPIGESVVFPPSRCPFCGHRLAAWENIPVLSWLVLGGRCSACKHTIAVRYPLVELAVSGLFVLAVLERGVSFEGLAMCALGAICIAILFVDLDHLLIPDALVVPCAIAAIALAALQHALLAAAYGAAIAGGVFLLIYFATRGRAMGLGDVKFAAALGLVFGPAGATAVIAASFIIGALVALPVLMGGKRGRRDALPFGPFLVVAALLLLFAPAAVFAPFDAYRHWLETRVGGA